MTDLALAAAHHLLFVALVAMLAAEAAPPSFYTVMMLAYMPLFRAEHHREMDALYTHLAQPQPRQEAVQLVGRVPMPVPHLVLGDMLPHRNAADAVGILTHGLVTRQQAYETLVAYALAPLMSA